MLEFSIIKVNFISHYRYQIAKIILLTKNWRYYEKYKKKYKCTMYVDSSFRTLLQLQSPFAVRTQQVPDFFVVDLDVGCEDQELYIVRYGYGFENVFKSSGYHPTLVRRWIYTLHRETLTASRLSVCEHCTIVTFQNPLYALNIIYYTKRLILHVFCR